MTPANSGKLWLMQCWWQGDFFFLQITDITHLNSLDNGGGRETLLTDKNGLEHPHRHMCTHSRLQFTVDMISWFMGLCVRRPLRVSRITLLSIDIYMIFLPVSPVKIFIHHAQPPCHCNGRSSNHFFVHVRSCIPVDDDRTLIGEHSIKITLSVVQLHSVSFYFTLQSVNLLRVILQNAKHF